VKRILCLYPFDIGTQARLRALSPQLDITFAGTDSQGTVDQLEDGTLDALFANFCPADLKRLPSLSWLAAIGAGVEHLRGGDPWSHAVTVTNGSGLHGTAIAEYVVASMLFFSQKIAQRQRTQIERAWPGPWTEPWKALLGAALRGRTVTIVGYGSIGREVARLAQAVGMRILAVKARPTVKGDRGYSPPGLGDPEGSIPERFGDLSELAAFFSRTDYAVLTLPSTPATERVVGAAAIAALPAHAVLINVARGRILDEQALCDALARGKLRFAVLDVASTEPVAPDSPLWLVPNLILTPHISAINEPEGWWELVARLMSENLARYAAGRELLNVVNGAAGY
jgi:phosphoglycerate dehydrogenase-like enzyme